MSYNADIMLCVKYDNLKELEEEVIKTTDDNYCIEILEEEEFGKIFIHNVEVSSCDKMLIDLMALAFRYKACIVQYGEDGEVETTHSDLFERETGISAVVEYHGEDIGFDVAFN